MNVIDLSKVKIVEKTLSIYIDLLVLIKLEHNL